MPPRSSLPAQRPSAWRLGVATAGLLLAACASPPQPVLERQLPAAWPSAPVAAAQAPAPDLRSWWKALGDPTLDALVERALQQNLTLAQARSRLRQARTLAGRDAAQFLPALSAGARTVQDVAAVDNYFHAGIDVAWELGLFGARPAVDTGAVARTELAIAGEQAARVSLTAELVRQYLLLTGARQELAALERLKAADDRALELHEVRRRTGSGSIDERRAVEQRRAQADAALAAPRLAAAQATQAIAVLLSRTEVDAAALTSSATAAVPAAFRLDQLPTDLLRYRPDVRQAEAEVGRAAAELGLARAELYPRVTLGLTMLFAYNITQNRRNVNDSLPAMGLSVDVPLFDWNRRRAAADAREQALEAAQMGYRQTVVEAYGETESALIGLAHARERVERGAEVQALAQRQLALQTSRAGFGLASALERVEAERGVLQAQADAASARAACAQAFVLLFKSLGGAPLELAVGAEPAQTVGAAR